MSYSRSVFINAPFDDAYLPMLHAITFAVQDCGFEVRCALESNDTGVTRLHKIEDLIAECQYSIHDLCRIEANLKKGVYPRFNMPFELGLCFGAKAYGDSKQKKKSILVMDTEQYRYRTFISDIGGQDPTAHGDDPARAIGAVRRFLADKVGKRVSLPGEALIKKRLDRFMAKLPAMGTLTGFKPAELNSLAYWRDVQFLMKEWQAKNPR